MNRNEVESYIKLWERLEKAKSKLPTLKIEWETDIEKMDFSKLKSFSNSDKINYTTAQLKTIPLEKIEENLFIVGDTERMLNLIELVSSGKKIIPPMYAIEYVIRNGEKMIYNQFNSLDGSHRKKLASYLGLTEIPVVVFERMKKYQFTVSKWKFEYNNDSLTVKSSTNEDSYTFYFNEWCVGLDYYQDFLELTCIY